MQLNKHVQTKLSPRLLRIFQQCTRIFPENSVKPAYIDCNTSKCTRPGMIVADIGTDHGHLASSLSTRNDVRHVFATDISPHAAALNFFERLPIECRQKITMLLGDGLKPLEQANVRTCDTVVLSGMGVSSLFEILCVPKSQQEESLNNKVPKTDYWSNLRLNNELLAALGVRRLVLAPWPPSFLSLQALLHIALQNENETYSNGKSFPNSCWRFSEQALDHVNGYLYLTCTLDRVEHADESKAKGNLRSEGTLSLQCNPLYQLAEAEARDTGTREDQEQVGLWRSYLKLQLTTLRKRQHGLALKEKVQQKTDLDHAGTPMYSLNALIEMLERHCVS